MGLRWVSGGAQDGACCADAARFRRFIYVLRLHSSAAACGGRRAGVFLGTRCKSGHAAAAMQQQSPRRTTRDGGGGGIGVNDGAGGDGGELSS